MEITIQIETCDDCRHSNHTGAFTPGGSKPCCNHPDYVERKFKQKGDYSCFDRVIPHTKITKDNRNVFNKQSFHRTSETYTEIKKIPDFCELKKGGTY